MGATAARAAEGRAWARNCSLQGEPCAQDMVPMELRDWRSITEVSSCHAEGMFHARQSWYAVHACVRLRARVDAPRREC